MRYCRRLTDGTSAFRSAITTWIASAHFSAASAQPNSADAVAGRVYHPPAMLPHHRQHRRLVRFQRPYRAFLGRTDERRAPGDISRQDRGKLAGGGGLSVMRGRP